MISHCSSIEFGSVLISVFTPVGSKSPISPTLPASASPTRQSQTADPVFNRIYHKVTGLRLAASATAHSLARPSRLAAPSGWLVVLVLHWRPIHMAHYVQI